jgi:hypothetical protein
VFEGICSVIADCILHFPLRSSANKQTNKKELKKKTVLFARGLRIALQSPTCNMKPNMGLSFQVIARSSPLLSHSNGKLTSLPEDRGRPAAVGIRVAAASDEPQYEAARVFDEPDVEVGTLKSLREQPRTQIANPSTSAASK